MTAKVRNTNPVLSESLLDASVHRGSADLRIAGQEDRLRATLCRCGASQQKPFCDGSHAESGFVASAEARLKESQPLVVRDGPLTVTPQKNGPLQVEGNLELCCGTGHTIDRTTQTRLCRCGHSENKPFCDGSHRRAECWIHFRLRITAADCCALMRISQLTLGRLAPKAPFPTRDKPSESSHLRVRRRPEVVGGPSRLADARSSGISLGDEPPLLLKCASNVRSQPAHEVSLAAGGLASDIL